MDVCVCVYSVFVLFSVCGQRPCDGLITRPKSPAGLCKNDYDTDEGARAQQKAVETLIIIILLLLVGWD
jgi:hypothetical protein